jgi:CheY-like chemotaxis protein
MCPAVWNELSLPLKPKEGAIRADPNISDGVILMADDDVNNHLIVKCALEEVGFRGIFKGVVDGLELMDFLFCRGKHKHARIPDLILLDLNMPGKDGRSALQAIKADLSLRRIPVAVLTSSASQDDIELCSRFRKCSYMTRPTNYQEWTRSLVEILLENLPSWNPAVPLVDEPSHFCEQQ